MSTLAGTASRRHSATRAAAVYWAIISPLSTPGSSARNGGRPWLRVGVEEAVGPALAHAGDVGDDDGQQVAGVGERRAVEVADRLDPPVGEHDRVVDGRRQLPVGARLGEGERVAGGAVDLRRAPQRVRVLDTRVAGAVRRHDGRAGEQRARCWRPTPAGPGWGRERDEVGGEGAGRCRADPRRSWPRRRRRPAAARRRSAQASTSMPSIPSVPLIEGEALLGLERQVEGGGDVGERREIAAAAERPELRDLGQRPVVEQVEQRGGQLRPGAGDARWPACGPAGAPSPARPRPRPGRPCRRRARRSASAAAGPAARAGSHVVARPPNPVEMP